MCAFHDPRAFAFVPALEAAFPAIAAEALSLDPLRDFVESPDSLTTAADGYDERGWRWFGLYGGAEDHAERRARCPAAARACAAVPGMRNAGLSLFLPGTHLYPHAGELNGVLRCHLPLIVPDGDVAIRFGTNEGGWDTRRWQPGRCMVFDDTCEHEAWNRSEQNRVVLIVTFAR